MRKFNPDKELYKIQHGNRNKIIVFVFLLLIVGVIGYSFALYQVRYSKRIIYTKVAPFSSKDLDLAVYVNGVNQSSLPDKDSGYNFCFLECDNGVPFAEWDEERWNFKQISNIDVPNKCNVYFSDVVQEYTLTSKVEEYQIPKDGIYRLEVWGAQGGSGRVPGGLGGYSVGDIYLTKGTKLYVVVGGAGSGNGTHVAQSGGYNGGGDAKTNNDSNTRMASGGGATHIATRTGLLSELEDYKNEILIVAGGGGGIGFNNAVWNNYTYEAGTGGGLIGGTGSQIVKSDESIQYQGYGGTQDSGGGYYKAATSYSSGTFGVGGTCLVGGGGGYYGGGCHGFAGGGGSGHLNVEKLIVGTTNTINGMNEGDGKARISYIGEVE